MASETTALPTPVPDVAAHAAPSTSTMPQKIARSRSGLAEFLEMLLVTMLLALFGTTFVVQAFKIPSGSMEQIHFRRHRRVVRKISALSRYSPRRHHRLQISLRRSPALCEARDRPAG